ncbi:MAG: hypothetical protein A2W91_03985 [Bacteroidetes bacterium GWF2_38_335]|nr:MAG: hypothetical protein A2W91_03985 [Bacteroidetes bacterium GWF2_38_335]OFY79111.1 MAG: hypothetical protein A2281_03320 [Bacteroidetes bacterium RIFOXYA12_FULL_38_20]HBS88803.1 hypothetical protein [Bacteroidales bacterium]
MFKVNEYFDGKVKSIGFENKEGKLTVGVMKAGEYEFGTSTVEHMTVTSGKMDVMMPGESNWKTYNAGQTFIVAKDIKFKVKMAEDTSYKCLYV